MDFDANSLLNGGGNENMSPVAQLIYNFDMTEPIQLNNVNYEELENINASTANNNATQTTITNNAATLTSSALQRIYYASENDAVELQNLLASWNLENLFDYFARTWSLYYRYYFSFMNLHSSLHSLH